MAEFKKAFEIMIAHEGGYGNDPSDPGGETYKGVARKINSKWDGWPIIDMLKRSADFPVNLEKDVDLQNSVFEFYQLNYWDKVKGDDIQNQDVANSIFDFAVNAGVSASAALAQLVVNAKIDGVIGKQSIDLINAFDTEHFLAAFTVSKIARYVNIVKKRPISRKYFYGWVLRALNED